VVYRCDLVEDGEAGEEEVANEGERECAGGSKSEGDEGN
jgi:hypothetical protein